MDRVGGSEIGPQTLQVLADQGLSVLTLGEDTGEDYVVRTFTSGLAAGQQLKVLGNTWDPRLICENFDVVVQVFREFFETGNVSRELLN